MTPLEKEQRSLETINRRDYRISVGDYVYADLSEFFETDAGCLAHKAECIVVECVSNGHGDIVYYQVWCWDKMWMYEVDAHLVTLRFKAVYEMPETKSEVCTICQRRKCVMECENWPGDVAEQQKESE